MQLTIKLIKHGHLAETAFALLLLVVYPINCAAGELTEFVGTSAPELELPDFEKKMRHLDEDAFAGKVVLINFWASWCRPCIEEIPAIRKLINTMSELELPFAVIGVNVGEGERRAAATAERLGINYTVLLDRDSKAFRNWGAKVLPTAFVMDTNGSLRFFAQGPVEWDSAEMVDLLSKLAKAPEPG